MDSASVEIHKLFGLPISRLDHGLSIHGMDCKECMSRCYERSHISSSRLTVGELKELGEHYPSGLCDCGMFYLKGGEWKTNLKTSS
jgi:hypothetical protein